MRRIIPIISLLLIPAIAGAGFWLGLPKYENWKKLKADLEVKIIQVKAKEEYSARLREASQALKDYSEEMSKISSGLPLTADFPSLFNFIEELTTQSGVLLEDLQAGNVAPLTDNTEVKAVSFSLSVAGSYSAMKNLLTALHKTARLVEIDGISFQSSEEQAEGIFKFDIKLKTASWSPAPISSGYQILVSPPPSSIPAQQ